MHRIATALALAAAGLGVAHADAPADAARDPGPMVSATVAYTGERLENVGGGLRRGGTYLDNLDLQAELNGERLFGVPGLKLFAYALYDNGHAFDGTYVGSAQGISNIETDSAWRLFEAWADWQVGPGSLKVGLYNLNSEFDVNATGALFLNPAHGIGTDFAQTGRNGPSIFPVTSMGARYGVSAGDWSFRIAALDGVPGDPAHPHRTAVRFESGDGALLVAEAEHALGAGRAAVGAWRYTAAFDDVLATDASGAPARRRGSSGVYGIVEGPVWTGEGERALGAFLRAGVADARTNPFSRYVGAGLVCTGPFPGRPKDQLGLALAHVATGGPFRDAAALAGAGLTAGELNAELAYRVELADGFFLQPDLQYVVDPGADPALANAWVVGLRFKASWGWAR